MAALSYAKSGVDIRAADEFVDRIAGLAKSTLNRRVKASIGGYASIYELDRHRWLAASTDGVGTKLKLAFQLDQHRTVGIDLVAMSVNDILCVGAEPLFFLDYFATGKLSKGIGVQVLEGIVEGCRQAGCALVGGETAEMPDFYTQGEYDLAGFAVGFLDPKQVLPKRDIRPGDVLIGIASSGLHSNGFSLARKLLPSGKKGQALARELLTPTRIYARSLLPLIRSGAFKGLAHITGSGLLNVPRMSEKVSYRVQLAPEAKAPRIYRWMREASGLSEQELSTTFNLGIGMVGVVSSAKARACIRKLEAAGEKAWVIGEVIPKRRGKGPEILVQPERDSEFWLEY